MTPAATIPVDQSLLRTFTSIKIAYPEGRETSREEQRVYEPINNRVTYRLIDRDARRSSDREPLSVLGMRQESALALGYNTDRYATDIRVDGEGLARLCLVLTTRGALQMSLGGLGPLLGDIEHGLVYDGRQQRRFQTRDDTARLLMWIDASRLERALIARMDEPLHEALAFHGQIDWRSASSAVVRRAIGYFVSELNDQQGLASVPAALESFTDGLVQLMLSALPHNYSDRLTRRVAAPVPAHLRRALAFMHASADKPVTMADVAAAAGCGTRTLLNVFRRFRETTPLAAMHDIRLQHARAALLDNPDGASTREIARRFGFTNLSRFTAAYGKRFGQTPGETRRQS